MKVMGLHVLAEIHDCDKALLRDLNQLEALLKGVADENGMTVKDSVFHQFSQDGVSGMLIIPKANMTIHTWPEGGRATIDMVSCSEELNPLASCESLVGKFKASHMTAKSNLREIDVGPVALAV